MAADKEIMKQIETLRLDRPGRMHDMAAIGDTLGRCIIEALRELAVTYRDEAELWTKSGARGWKSSENEAYLIAQAVDSVAAQLDNAGGGAALSVSEAGPRNRNRQCDDPQPHERHENGTGEVTGDTLYCLGVRPPADLSGLDQLIADSAAEGRGQLHAEATIEPGSSYSGAVLDAIRDTVAAPVDLLDGQRMVEQPSDVAAYLSGAVDTLPGLREALVPGSVRSAPEAGNPFAIAGDLSAEAATQGLTLDAVATAAAGEPVFVPKTWESDTMTADGHTKPGVAQNLTPTLAPTLGQPGDMGVGYSHDYVPPGGRCVTFAELLTPVPVAILPPHVSNSQIDTAGDCLAKYRMQRVDQLPQIPQWANIGGTTFHAVVESWERMAAQYPGISLNEEDVEGAWKHHFENTIAVVQMSTTVPISSWRAARKGAEGRAWWEVNGPLMLRRYLDARPAEPTSNLPAMVASENGSPFQLAIELDLTVDVPTNYGPVPFKAKLDRVTNGPIPPDSAYITLVLRDYKTSYERPTDTTQLGDYAWTLRLWGVPESVKIMGSYFDARRGEWTEPVDLLAAHPFESFQYRVTAAHAQKLALTTGPTPARPSSYCGGCSVRYACPVMASRS